MGLEEKVAQAKTLIAQGHPVYKACESVGLNLRSWYRVTTGEERLMQERKVKRLKARRERLEAQIAAVDKELKIMTTPNGEKEETK